VLILTLTVIAVLVLVWASVAARRRRHASEVWDRAVMKNYLAKQRADETGESGRDGRRPGGAATG